MVQLDINLNMSLIRWSFFLLFFFYSLFHYFVIVFIMLLKIKPQSMALRIFMYSFWVRYIKLRYKILAKTAKI